MSQINTILDNVAALAPSYDSDVAISVRNVDQLKDTLQISDCPVRMLLVVDPDQYHEMAFVAMGKTAKVTWKIVDRLFIREATLGQGVAEWSDLLFTYTASYIEQVRSHRGIDRQATIVDVSFRPEVMEWGDGHWAVVDAVLTIEEFLGSA